MCNICGVNARLRHTAIWIYIFTILPFSSASCSSRGSASEGKAIRCVQTHDTDKLADVFLMNVYPLPFITSDWTTFSGVEGAVIGYPIEAYLKCYIRGRGITIRVTCPSDFSGLGAVYIKSENEALSFVQFFNRGDTFFMFNEPRAIELSLAPIEAEEIPSRPGSLSRILYNKLGIELPSVYRESDGFICRRYVVEAKMTEKGYPLQKRVERVTVDGDYQLLSSQMIATIPGDAIHIPRFE